MPIRWFFPLFLVSGFCGLVYQVVWLRLAMASFGVTAPLVSIVLSVFMAGLALGSWGGGRLGAHLLGRGAAGPLRLYALAELVVAASGGVVPLGLSWGRDLLAGASAEVAWGSLGHYVRSGALVTVVLLPFCVGMGSTFPLAMAALREGRAPGGERSFSYLYLANVLGAFAGTLLSALVLIEVLGFRATLSLAAGLNALLAAIALGLSLRAAGPKGVGAAEPTVAEPGAPRSRRAAWAALFATGFSSMGMEVVWVRQLTPYLGTLVYAFAVILALYLLATFTGSALYRRHASGRSEGSGALAWSARWSVMGALGLLPLLAADPRLGSDGFPAGALRAAIGIVPLSLALGYFTPMLLDRWSSGDARRAGSAYAVNMVGCILGPLAAGFVFLPWLGERWSLLLLALPLFGLGLLDRGDPLHRNRAWVAALAAVTVLLLLGTADYETLFPGRTVLRDYTATVVATGEGMQKGLLVNGVGMTKLSSITKMMAHLPMAFAENPRSGLALCFGMGVTFSSLRSWGIDTTAVELIPSVPSLFEYYHSGRPLPAPSREARVVIDDARRFLERTPEAYDVITIDPPPPIEAAGSSLLYSREFYAVAGRRLRDGGVLQQWLPAGDRTVASSVARAILESFPYVRTFSSTEGWGVHFLASHRPLAHLTAAEAAGRLPAAAVADLLEWGPASTAEQQLDLVLRREFPPSRLVGLDPEATALRDDHPVNEYYLLRRVRATR